MTDLFAVLHQPRRPWLDPDRLKASFLRLSAEAHPDRIHAAGPLERSEAQRTFTELNEAYRRLRGSKERLQHLLELELGRKPMDLQEIPPQVLSLFLQVSSACREADVHVAQKAAITSPLLKLEWFAQAQPISDKLAAEDERVAAWQAGLERDLKEADREWENPERRPNLLARIEELWRLFSFGNKWASQIKERILLLSQP